MTLPEIAQTTESSGSTAFIDSMNQQIRHNSRSWIPGLLNLSSSSSIINTTNSNNNNDNKDSLSSSTTISTNTTKQLDCFVIRNNLIESLTTSTGNGNGDFGSTSLGLSFIPNCTVDGYYEPVQCSTDMQFCWCVNKVTGHSLKSIKVRNIINCFLKF